MSTHSSCRILLLSKTLVQGDILNNNGLLSAILNWCDNIVAQNRRKIRNDDDARWSTFLHRYGLSTKTRITYALSQVHLFAQFVCRKFCSIGRIDFLTCVEASRTWIGCMCSCMFDSSFLLSFLEIAFPFIYVETKRKVLSKLFWLCFCFCLSPCFVSRLVPTCSDFSRLFPTLPTMSHFSQIWYKSGKVLPRFDTKVGKSDTWSRKFAGTYLHSLGTYTWEI